MAPQAYAPGGYAPPPGGYGAPPGGYGAPPGGYGAPPGGYGAPPGGYGAPNPYGGPQPGPYGGPMPGQQVHGFGGVQPFNAGYTPQYRSSGWASGWSTFFWVRLGIAAVAIAVSLLGACVSALSH